MSAQFWLRLQMDYDLDVSMDQLSEKLETEVQTYSTSA
jgi:plasmid maintenance system antidote protein VapI